MSFELSDVGLFKEVIGVVEKYIEDSVRFTLGDDGLGFTCLDKPHVVFLDGLVSKDWFTVYNYSDDMSFIVDIRELRQALSRISNSSCVTCSLTEEYLILRAVGVDGGKSFKLRLISDEYDSPTPPNLPYNGKISVDFEQLKEYTLDASLYGGKVSYNLLDDNKLLIKSENDYTEYEAIMNIDNNDGVEPCRVVLTTEKLVDLFKLKSLPECTIKIGNGMPLTIELRDTPEDVCFTFLLAPRIEDE